MTPKRVGAWGGVRSGAGRGLKKVCFLAGRLYTGEKATYGLLRDLGSSNGREHWLGLMRIKKFRLLSTIFGRVFTRKCAKSAPCPGLFGLFRGGYGAGMALILSVRRSLGVRVRLWRGLCGRAGL